MSTQRFDSLLIANRGEIACRIIRSARALGIRTIAVYSDADLGAPHVRLADEAYHIGAAAPRASYLNVQALLEVAKRADAKAIHPGYGFLSERAEFCAAVLEAGLLFVGPDVHAINAMGDKASSKQLMRKANVPCVPGYDGADQSPETLRTQADAIGYPLLVKASAGGGGRGMRRVSAAGELEGAIVSAKTEALAAFGSDALLLERWVERGRHIEVQVLADRHGNTIHLLERDCSAQRRHQKVIEEAPSPALSPELRAKIGAAAVRAAQAVNYVGAGTVEFMMDDGGEFYFLEMNTRLQVEHPVTELICDIDLVKWQLRITAGEPLTLRQEEITARGHAIEARVYAEDPANGFAPQTGRVIALRLPSDEGVRIDAGLDEGQVIGADYDAMIAKVIAWGESRELARQRLDGALRHTCVLGLHTNVDYLLNILRSEEFRGGEMTTHLLDSAQGQALKESPPRDPAARAAAIGVWLACAASARGLHRTDATAAVAMHFRNAHPEPQRIAIELDGEALLVSVQADTGGCSMTLGDRTHRVVVRHLPGMQDNERLVIVDGAAATALWAIDERDALWLAWHGQTTVVRIPRTKTRAESQAGTGNLRAPGVGTVTRVQVAVGEHVAKGQALLALEAMKMETVLCADVAGLLKELRAAPGKQVAAGDLLAVIEPDPAEVPGPA